MAKGVPPGGGGGRPLGAAPVRASTSDRWSGPGAGEVGAPGGRAAGMASRRESGVKANVNSERLARGTAAIRRRAATSHSMTSVVS